MAAYARLPPSKKVLAAIVMYGEVHERLCQGCQKPLPDDATALRCSTPSVGHLVCSKCYAGKACCNGKTKKEAKVKRNAVNRALLPPRYEYSYGIV